MPSFITFLCTTKNGRSERLTVKKSDFIIGRSKECAVYMPFPEVSRSHCRVEMKHDHSVEFTDVRESSVGILHNGKYKKQGVLNPGDEFFIGDTRFVLVEFAGNVVVTDSGTDQIHIDDILTEGLSKAESAIQTALGISLVSGKTEQETGDVMSWSDITAISIAAQQKAPLPSAPPKPEQASNPQNKLLILMMVACLAVAVAACGIAVWAIKSKNDAQTPTPATESVEPPAPKAAPGQ